MYELRGLELSNSGELGEQRFTSRLAHSQTVFFTQVFDLSLNVIQFCDPSQGLFANLALIELVRLKEFSSGMGPTPGLDDNSRFKRGFVARTMCCNT